MLSSRSKLSLMQLLLTISWNDLQTLLEKYFGIRDEYLDQRVVRGHLFSATNESIMNLCAELVKTGRTFRLNISPRWAYDQRWSDFSHCLLLDGFLVRDEGPSENRQIVPIDPSMGDAGNIEDDLTAELRRTNLTNIDGILQTLSNSSEDFRRNPPDYNGCLNNARVGLQTLATAIARDRMRNHPGSFDETSWGQVIAYLRVSGFITAQEENGLTGVFTFVSPGSHRPIGISDAEATRLGRSFVFGMCYFLAKQYNGCLS